MSSTMLPVIEQSSKLVQDVPIPPHSHSQNVADLNPDFCVIREDGRLPLSHPQRRRNRDEKLWRRERKMVLESRNQKLCCPCVKCKGNVAMNVKTVETHLMKTERHPTCRVWQGEDMDSSDDEWREVYLRNYGSAALTSCMLRQPQERGNESTGVQLGETEMHVEGTGMQDRETVVQGWDTTDLIEDTVATNDEQLETNDEQPDSPCDSIPFDFDAFLNLDALDGGVMDVEGADGDASEAFADPMEVAFQKVMKPLYPGSKTDMLNFMLLFMNICGTHGFSNKGVDELLALLRKYVMPDGHCLPKNIHASKQMLKGLGLGYEKIHACPAGCVLFKKDKKDLEQCPECGMDRYHKVGKSLQAVHVLRHFPIIPRLKRLFRSKPTSDFMMWHSENMSKDGMVRHVPDSKAWAHFNSKYPDFAKEPRNVRYGLATDGVNPFGNNLTSWSTWPVLLLNYNIPPWYTTKKFFVLLALLIPGPETVTERNFDVYMEPLLEELLELWHGVPCIDVVKRVGQSQEFTLQGSVLWTINDYPAYGLLSGQQTKGYKACVVCGPRVSSRRSPSLNKQVFQGHRRYLKARHAYQKESNAHFFNGIVEKDPAPARLSGSEREAFGRETLDYLRAAGTKLDDDDCPVKKHGVKRVTCLYKLPYWKDLLINHTLDVMHIEKNMTHNLVHTVIGTKDTPQVRKDMEGEKLHKHLWLKPDTKSKKKDKMLKPRAPYCLKKDQLPVFLETLASLRVPTGFCSTLAKCVRAKKKLSGLKSHDYHQLMQQVLPLALIDLMDQGPRLVIGRVSRLYRRICAKVWDPSQYDALMEDVAFTLCALEMHFPPSFFDVMTHLLVHVIEEVDMCGPVSTRWMYPVERYLKVLKGYVRNKARPEASMAEGYILEEALGFVSEYTEHAAGICKRVWDAEEAAGVSGMVMERKGKKVTGMTIDQVTEMHKYVIKNEELVEPFYRRWSIACADLARQKAEFKESWIRDNPENCRRVVPYPNTMTDVPPFPEWFRDDTRSHEFEDQEERQILTLYSIGPSVKVVRYEAMKAYGHHWRVMPIKRLTECDGGEHKTFDSGMACLTNEKVVNRRGETNVRGRWMVGVLTDILVLDYGLLPTPVVLFKGKWVDTKWKPKDVATIRLNESGLMQADFRAQLHASKEWDYVRPAQVQQVFFHPNRKGAAWRTILLKESRSTRVIADVDDITLTVPVDDNQLVHSKLAKACRTCPNLLLEAEPLTRRDAFDVDGDGDEGESDPEL